MGTEKEKVFFNALNTLNEGSYARMSSGSKEGGWEKAWRKFGSAKIDPQKLWKDLARNGIRLVLKNESDFPRLLKEIPHPPFGIYIKGSIPDFTASLAVVGTRKPTEAGIFAARTFSGSLAERGVAIISGLALGIDRAAHEAALDAHGKTVAVLANGLDSVYPKFNSRLAKRILDSGGATVSEYPPGSEPKPYRFLERNRIISGLARGTLVIEAPRRSGSLATARFALEQNRDVFAVPGPIKHLNYEGSNELIRAGAYLVASPSHILENFGLSETAESEENLNADERIVLEFLRAQKGAGVDEISNATKLQISAVNQTLSFLLIRGIIKEDGKGYSV